MLKDNLRKARLTAGLSKAEVARRLKMGYTTYDGYETGRRTPKPDSLPEIAKVLGVDVNYLTEVRMSEGFEKGLRNMANKLFQWAKDARLSELVEGYDSLNLSAQLQFSEIANKFNLLNDEGRTLLLADAEKYLSSPALRNVEDASAQPTEETPTDT